MPQKSALRLVFAVGLLASGVAIAATPGRDFVPFDWAQNQIVPKGGANMVLADVFVLGQSPWLLYIDRAAPGALQLVRFDPNTGAKGTIVGAPVTVLSPEVGVGSVEAHGINSGQLAECGQKSVTNEPLAWDGTRFRLGRIGVSSSSVRVTGSGGTCNSVAMAAGSFTFGYDNGGVRTTDGLGLSGTDTCRTFTASYTYTTCGFSGTAAYRCALSPDPVADADAELGACRYLMVYESSFDADNDKTTPDDRALLTAHARQLTGPWQRFLPSGGKTPTLADVRVLDTARHGPDTQANIHSFVSVPTLVRDPVQGLLRMWFVTEETRRTSVRYTESDDDGQSWGIGGGSGGTIDCWDGAAFDESACLELGWAGTPPPDDLNLPDTRSPDSVDPEVIVGEFDGRAGADLGMLFTGGDDACPNGDGGVQLFATHPAFGDASAGAAWTWATNVAADAVDGVVVDNNAAACGAPLVTDAEIVAWNGGFVGFWNGQGGLHVGASGFACSNFRDDDGKAGADWPADPDCRNPWDNSE